jgi:hypothetical protein
VGAIGVILLGFAAIFNLVNLCVPTFSKVPAAILAFAAGVAFFIGALIYEGMRPSWGGDSQSHCTRQCRGAPRMHE